MCVYMECYLCWICIGYVYSCSSSHVGFELVGVWCSILKAILDIVVDNEMSNHS